MSGVQIEKTIFIKSPNKYLGDVLDDLPDNIYLNKTSTGCGGSHIVLTNDVNYILLVPYRSAIKNKLSQHENIIAVQAGVEIEDIVRKVKVIKNSNKINNGVVKIMSTYDSFHKVYDAIKQIDMLQDFKLCIDEAHVLVSLAKIKGKCFNFLYKHYREFKSFVFLTATPNDKTLLPTPIKDVDFVRVVWEAAEKVHIIEQRVKNVNECNKFVIEICKQHLLGEVDGNAYIFYNSVNEIVSVIQKLKKMEGFNQDNVNIFCAENPYNDKKINLHLGKGFTDGSFNDNKKINFLSSANYESCDIYDTKGRTYIIVSSKRNSTALTNHILVPQICGRLRRSEYKTEAKMIVCGFEDDIYQKDLDVFMEALSKMESTAKYLIERSIKTKQDGYEEAYMKDVVSFSTNPFIIVNDDMTLEFNEGAVLSEMQAYQAFNSYIVTIPNNDHINMVRTVDNDMLKVSDESRLLVEDKVDFSRLMRKYINALESGDIETINMIQKRSEIHKQYVSVLGVNKVKSIGYNKTKLSNAYNLAIKFSQSNQEIKSNLKKLKIGGKYTSAHIISLLQSVYNDLGIDRKAVSNDIKNYFNVTKTQVVCPVDGKRKQGFRIVGDIYEEEL